MMGKLLIGNRLFVCNKIAHRSDRHQGQPHRQDGGGGGVGGPTDVGDYDDAS